MCFSPLVTWSTAGLGFATSLFAISKNKPATLYLPPAYFGFMEVLQGLMYIELHFPSQWIVNILVYTAYIHVCFQPLVFNYWLGSFINPAKKAIYRFTLQLCFIGALFLLSRMFMSGATPLCNSYETLCSATPQVYYGFHHIVWSIPLAAGGFRYVTPSIFLHMFLFFMPGVLFGLYRLMIAFFVLGPLLAAYITPNVSEQSSIWCVMGLWLLVITIWASIANPPRFLIPRQNATD